MLFGELFVVQVMVRAQFCKIDRVLLGMQFGVLVRVLFWGVAFLQVQD